LTYIVQTAVTSDDHNTIQLQRSGKLASVQKKFDKNFVMMANSINSAV